MALVTTTETTATMTAATTGSIASAATTTAQRIGFAMDWDTAGAAASFACAVHCALLPIVVTLLPLVGLGFLANAATEWVLVALSAALGIGSLCLGFREHRSRRAFAVLATGLALLILGRWAEANATGWIGVAVVVVGGCTVAASHIVNRRLCRACLCCHPTKTPSNLRNPQ